MKIGQIAQLVKGDIFGDGDIDIKGIASCDIAVETDATFALSEKDMEKLKDCKASCIISREQIEGTGKTVLKVPDIKSALTIIYNLLANEPKMIEKNIHPSATVSSSAKIGEHVQIGANVVIDDHAEIGDNSIIKANTVIGRKVVIGKNCLIYPNVSIYDYSVVGNKNIIHSGTVIGSDGFGFIQEGGVYYKVPQLGKVIIKDNVEIGANACIDRGTFMDTIISQGTKVDNHVQIAHNVNVGSNVVIAALTGIAGSSTIGNNVMMGGMVGIADHVAIGENAKIGAKTGVTGNVPENDIVFGYPHRTAREAKKIHGLLSLLIKHSKKLRAFLRNLPE